MEESYIELIALDENIMFGPIGRDIIKNTLRGQQRIAEIKPTFAIGDNKLEIKVRKPGDLVTKTRNYVKHKIRRGIEVKRMKPDLNVFKRFERMHNEVLGDRRTPVSNLRRFENDFRKEMENRNGKMSVKIADGIINKHIDRIRENRIKRAKRGTI